MSKEGLKKAKGGILKQDTRHGKMDMPFQKLNRFAGMKKGGIMKKRRFDEGGDVDGGEEEYSAHQIDPNSRRAHGLYDEEKPVSKSSAKSVAKATAKPVAKATAKPVAKATAKKSADYGDEGDRLRARAGDYEDQFKGISRASRLMRRDDAAGVKQPSSAAEPTTGGFSRYFSEPLRRLRERMSSGDQQSFKPRDRGFRKGGLMRSKKDIGKDQMDMAPYKKGGSMESKAMMKKEISFMKKKGAPASMIKHEQAEAKGYKKGGSIKETMGPRNMSQDVEGGYKAKHLKHGEHSEQKRGHTKGTVIKMAAGGSVRAHGEHSIQLKGHTRGKMC
jgi:hypothetical protein